MWLAGSRIGLPLKALFKRHVGLYRERQSSLDVGKDRHDELALVGVSGYRAVGTLWFCQLV